MSIKQQNQIRLRRTIRSRAQSKGTAAVPRLSVFRSNKNIAAQLINDTDSKTIASASTYDIDDNKKKKSDAAFQVGETIAKKAIGLGITRAAFDRGSYRYHGRVKAVCDGARKGGLII
ncbi:MAG: 50S ribosomal protein L18 [bacterium]|nr:50S ribosomal protein L18 [bacterium]